MALWADLYNMAAWIGQAEKEWCCPLDPWLSHWPGAWNIMRLIVPSLEDKEEIESRAVLFKKMLFIYLAASDLSCGMESSLASLRYFALVHRLSNCAWALLVVVPRDSCPAAYGISGPWRGLCVPCIARQIVNHWMVREVPNRELLWTFFSCYTSSALGFILRWWT